MIKKTITFTDFNGNERVDDFYFNLTIDELVDLELSPTESVKNHLNRIINSDDSIEIYKVFKKIVLAAYGKKSDDGLRFIKNEELKEEFSQTNAFSELLFEFIKNSESAAEFINALIPKDKIKELTTLLDGSESKKS